MFTINNFFFGIKYIYYIQEFFLMVKHYLGKVAYMFYSTGTFISNTHF